MIKQLCADLVPNSMPFAKQNIDNVLFTEAAQWVANEISTQRRKQVLGCSLYARTSTG